MGGLLLSLFYLIAWTFISDTYLDDAFGFPYLYFSVSVPNLVDYDCGTTEGFTVLCTVGHLALSVHSYEFRACIRSSVFSTEKVSS